MRVIAGIAVNKIGRTQPKNKIQMFRKLPVSSAFRASHTKLYSTSSNVPSKGRNLFKTALVVATGAVAVGVVGFQVVKRVESVDPQLNEQQGHLKTLLPNVKTARHHWQMSAPFPPIAMSSNMYLVELRQSGSDQSSEMLVYNPVRLTSTLKQELVDQPVKYLVVANREHTLFFEDYLKEFPEIICYCPPSDRQTLINKLKNKQFADRIVELSHVAETQIALPETFAGKYENQLLFKYVRGFDHLNEVVMLYKPDKLLFACDTAMNIQDSTFLRGKGQPSLTNYYIKALGLYGHIGVSKMFRYIVSDQKLLLQSIDEICTEDISGIAMAHGEPILSDKDVKEKWKKSWNAIF